MAKCGESSISRIRNTSMAKGANNSYMTFDHWQLCTTTKLQFDFRTHLANGLLLYQDDGNGVAFLELKLVAGQLVMRLKVAEDKVLGFKIGENLDNGEWHMVRIERFEDDILLKMNSSLRKVALDLDTEDNDLLGASHQRSPLYVGGLPQLYTLMSGSFSLPSIFYEPRFSGSINNVLMGNCSNQMEAVEPVSTNGLILRPVEGCEETTPCLNDGRCLSSPEGFRCDCQYTFYHGSTCSLRKRLL
ncbi:neurexin 1-like [Watersipora subatra]|uniref:neurexin 1-like n=1 Tax=Watersipora subatra TaxID=2589382 RepID=UPI00355B420D